MSVATPGTGLGTVLGVWAHPDDEAYLSSGLMAQAAASGSRVVCVTATRGEGGSLDPERWTSESLGDVRAAELQRCLSLLGIQERIFLDIQLDPDLLELKVAAICEHESQIEGLVAAFGEDLWAKALARESFRCAERRPA